MREGTWEGRGLKSGRKIARDYILEFIATRYSLDYPIKYPHILNPTIPTMRLYEAARIVPTVPPWDTAMKVLRSYRATR